MDIEQIFRSGTPRSFAPGEVILHAEREPRGVFRITEGYCFVITYNHDGAQRIHAIYGPGAIFPLRHTLYDQLPIATFEAFTDVELQTVPTATFLESLNESAFSRACIDQIMHQFACYVRGIEVLEIRDRKSRLIHKLIDLFEQLGEDKGSRVSLPFGLTHEQLGRLITVSRETVSRVLNDDDLKNLLSSEPQRFTCTNLEALKDLQS